MQASELVAVVRDRKFSVVCFADLPPSPSSKTRYLVKKLRAALPNVRIAVGRWAPPALADDGSQALVDAGANHVAVLLVDTRNYLGSLLELPRVPAAAIEIPAGHEQAAAAAENSEKFAETLG